MNEIKTASDFRNYVAKHGYFSHGRYCMILDGREYDIESLAKVLALTKVLD